MPVVGSVLDLEVQRSKHNFLLNIQSGTATPLPDLHPGASVSGSQEFNYKARQQSSIPGEVSSIPRPGVRNVLNCGRWLSCPKLHLILMQDSVIEDEVKLSIWHCEQEKTEGERGEPGGEVGARRRG